jgi:hypothetical protein
VARSRDAVLSSDGGATSAAGLDATFRPLLVMALLDDCLRTWVRAKISERACYCSSRSAMSSASAIHLTR